MNTRCLLVDDSPRFLAAARTLLEREGVAVVGVASTGAEALERAGRLRPDVVLLDLHLGRESGLDLAGRLPCDVILISTHAGDDYADLVDASPAVGFISKADLSAGAIRRLLEVA